MQSAVMAARLRKSIQSHTTFKLNHVILILDSTCTLELINKETSSLGEFMGNKVTEILEKSKPDEWYRAASEENIADLGTRCNTKIEDIEEGSIFQEGPRWMSLDLKD